MQQHALKEMIACRYREAHGATPAADYPSYLTKGSPDAPLAAIGLRFAGAGALFLERYLADPVEQVLTRAFDRPVPRTRIVELGDHASRRAAATVALWQEAAAALDGLADVAVAVLTAPLRAMFARLGLPLVALAPARIEAVGDAGAAWGRYYEQEPIVCAGEVSQCRAILGRRLAA